MSDHEVTVTPIKNGWHASVPAPNITVRGDTEEEARERLRVAVKKAVELRARSDAFEDR